MRFMPANDKPARLEKLESKLVKPLPEEPEPPAREPERPDQGWKVDLRSRVWSFIRQAPSLSQRASV